MLQTLVESHSADESNRIKRFVNAFDRIQVRFVPQDTDMPEFHADLVAYPIHFAVRCADFAHKFVALSMFYSPFKPKSHLLFEIPQCVSHKQCDASF